MKTMKLVFLMSLMIAIGCASNNMNSGMDIGPGTNTVDETPTLLVINHGIDVIRIYEGDHRLGTVYPGRSECILLRNYQSIRQLSFGFLAGFDRWYSAQERFKQGEHWTWNINSSLPRFSEIDIYPTTKCE